MLGTENGYQVEVVILILAAEQGYIALFPTESCYEAPLATPGRTDTEILAATLDWESRVSKRSGNSVTLTSFRR